MSTQAEAVFSATSALLRKHRQKQRPFPTNHGASVYFSRRCAAARHRKALSFSSSSSFPSPRPRCSPRSVQLPIRSPRLMSGADVIPACRVLRRRAAREDMGGGEYGDDGFWSAPPRLYDFSQQRLPALPAPPAPAPKAASPEAAPCSAGLMALLQRCDEGWGVRRVTYVRRLRPRRAVPAPRGEEDKKGSGGARKRKRSAEEVKEEEEAAEEVGRDDKGEVVKAEQSRGRTRTRDGLGRFLPVDAGRGKKTEDDGEVTSSGDNKRKPSGEDAAAGESSRHKSQVVKTETTRCYHRRRRDAATRAKMVSLKEEHDDKAKEEEDDDGKEEDDDEEKERNPAALVPKPGSPRGKVGRWSARRYATAEAAMLGILRARGASAGKPLPRGDLRMEARRHIGDTGLLDHLLRHAADKVPAGSAERVRRRYNAAGALEYWLEPAELAAVRREAGVADQYWVPPPGWKIGDPVSPDACSVAMKRQVEELAGELAVVKRQMEQLSSNLVQVSKEAYLSWKANEKLEEQVLSLEEKYENAVETNGELKEELLFLKENFELMVDKNSRLDEQMVALSTSLQTFKDDTPLQITGGEDAQDMLMLEQADPYVKEPSKSDTDKQEASACNAAAVDGSANSGGKSALRKCSMRICKPQKTFQWVSAEANASTAIGTACSPAALLEPLTPGGDLAMNNLDAMIYDLAPPYLEEYLVADGLPIPMSASSSTFASTQLPLPNSPIQPPQPTNVSRDDQAQEVQPYSGGLELQLRHTDTSTPSGPCGAKALMLNTGAGGGNVGTELALAIPNY
ncbi:hypothetical protein ACP4OV_023003 [Aristida adscensionis]